ncbi:MAG: hypothetical protein R3D80_19350 [Paracoccaceae bacterium]
MRPILDPACRAYLLAMHFVLLIIIGAAAGFIATRAMKLDPVC